MQDQIQNQNLKKNEKYKIIFFVFLFILLVSVDQLTKYFVKKTFLNYYFAFSLPFPNWLTYAVYAVVMFAMAFYSFNNYQTFSRRQAFAWVLIFAGAVSNITERIVFGYVRDWIYIFSGVFNLADVFIITGILLLLLQSEISNHKI